MVRYIYTSKIAQRLNQEGIQKIIQSAVKYNELNEITGLLISNFEYFFQVLEGPEQNVATLFNTIKTDNRHENIHLLTKDDVNRRLFPNWKMGYLTFPLEQPPTINTDWTKLTIQECETILLRVAPSQQ